MKIVTINESKRTKIADGSCMVRAKNSTYIIHFTNEEGKNLVSTYANNPISIRTSGKVYAESTKHKMELEVIENNPKRSKE